MRSFMALPLGDDQGLLGYLCLESRQESWDVEPAEGDTLSILAAQATVAIRNAQLYSEIPLRGVSLPVARLRALMSGLTSRGRAIATAAAVVALGALVLPVFPDRAGGPAEVRPLRVQAARAVTEGTIARTLVIGGEEVRRGQPLAEIDDPDLAAGLADLRARIEVARRDIASARRAGDASRWREGELRLEGLMATLAVDERRARATMLTAPFDGQILELDLAQQVGRYLEAGEGFCTIAALGTMAVDFDVAEEQIGRVRTGQDVSLKVMSYPTRVFRGRVIEVGWRGEVGRAASSRFTVRAQVDDPGRRLRPGMTGIARASLGRRPAGVMLLEPVWRGLLMAWS
jgi:RND family efflux transporter MFP subunit